LPDDVVGIPEACLLKGADWLFSGEATRLFHQVKEKDLTLSWCWNGKSSVGMGRTNVVELQCHLDAERAGMLRFRGCSDSRKLLTELDHVRK
jgi:hypothetical protein